MTRQIQKQPVPRLGSPVRHTQIFALAAAVGLSGPLALAQPVLPPGALDQFNKIVGKLWKVKWLEVGASYFWGKDFDGWSFGADVLFKF